MTIPQQYAHRCVYHFSHIDNLPGLIANGFLANNHHGFPGNHRSIAASSIQQRRALMQVTCGPGGYVHDYVPLYFGSCSPMLLSVLHSKNVDQCDILYFEFPISILESQQSVFTDASANTVNPPNFYYDPIDLNKLDWSAIDSLKWGSIDDEYRHHRMAEVLVYQQLPITAAARCVVWNEGIRANVEQMTNGSAFPPIEYEDPNRRHFFNNLELKDGSSLIIGPRQIASIYYDACVEIENHAAKGFPFNGASFKDLEELLIGLRNNFGCVPHTAELIGLKSANGVHKHTVDVHTRDVVSRLLALPEYAALDAKSKKLTELAAYLHDIGKGPRARWASNGGLQKVDPNHPVGAMPMMVEILTQQVQSITMPSAKALLKLVCYHDLVGDVLGRGRDEKQIIDVVADKDELDMLFAIGKADATSLVEQWWNQYAADQLYGRCLAAIQ